MSKPKREQRKSDERDAHFGAGERVSALETSPSTATTAAQTASAA